jgi:hypothetical protein
VGDGVGKTEVSTGSIDSPEEVEEVKSALVEASGVVSVSLAHEEVIRIRKVMITITGDFFIDCFIPYPP